MSNNYNICFINNDWLSESKFLYGISNSLNLSFIMYLIIQFIRDKFWCFYILYFHDKLSKNVKFYKFISKYHFFLTVIIFLSKISLIYFWYHCHGVVALIFLGTFFKIRLKNFVIFRYLNLPTSWYGNIRLYAGSIE